VRTMTTVESHFTKSDPEVLATYRRLLEAARALGRVAEEPKKTSIHLVRTTAFAGVATRRSSLILTLKSAKDIRSHRIEKREQASAHRWHVEVRLEKPADVDRQLTNWLSAAYELAVERQMYRAQRIIQVDQHVRCVDALIARDEDEIVTHRRGRGRR
jgi:hypothetical protein